MNNQLQIKEVNFGGDKLLAAQSNDNQKVYVGASWICNGLGFEKNYKDRQIKNIQRDTVLSRGCLKFDAGVFDPNNETLAIELDYLPLWLAKISITPAMKRNNPELVDKLVNYQLKAKDVLAQAFLSSPTPSNINLFKMALQEIIEHDAQLSNLNTTVAKLENDIADIKKGNAQPHSKNAQCFEAFNPTEPADIIRTAILPLIEKRGDNSKGGTCTYRKVYANMGIGWANRLGRYRNEHKLKNQPKKLTLIEQDARLMRLFISTINSMLNGYEVA